MRLLVLIAALFSTSAFAQLDSSVNQHPILERQSYSTIQEAAVKGLQQCYHFTDILECGGLLYKNKKDGTYRVTVPITSNSTAHVRIPMLDSIEGYGKPVADYHTHPCNPNLFSNYFSPDDIHGTDHFGDIGYMADLCTGRVHEYNPHNKYKMEVIKGFDQDDNPLSALVTEGSIVGSFRVQPPPERALFDQIIEPKHKSTPEDREQYRRNPEAHDQPHPLVDAKSFTDVHEAAVYGTYLSIHLSNQVEYGGLVLKSKTDNSYHVTVPVTAHNPASTPIPFDVDDYDDQYEIVAWYHTHPCVGTYIHGYFSVPDIAQSEYHHADAYMLNGCTGNIYEWQYGVDPVEDKFIAGNMRLTSGHQVGWIALTIKP